MTDEITRAEKECKDAATAHCIASEKLRLDHSAENQAAYDAAGRRVASAYAVLDAVKPLAIGDFIEKAG